MVVATDDEREALLPASRRPAFKTRLRHLLSFLRLLLSILRLLLSPSFLKHLYTEANPEGRASMVVCPLVVFSFWGLIYYANQLPGHCTSSACVVEAARLISAMNESMDPCEDFYAFANGAWVADTDIPAGQSTLWPFQETLDRNQRIIRRVIQSVPPNGTGGGAEGENLRKMRWMHDSCMDAVALDRLGTKSFMPLVDKVTGVMGRFDEADEEEEEVPWRGAWSEEYVLPEHLAIKAAEAAAFTQSIKKHAPRAARTEPRESVKPAADYPAEPVPMSKDRHARITKTLAYLHAHDVDALFSWVVTGDMGGPDPLIQMLTMWQRFGGLPSKEFYDEPAAVDLYQSVISDVLLGISATSRESAGLHDQAGLKGRMDTLAAKVIHLERALVRAGTVLTDLIDPSKAYNPYTPDELSSALPFLDVPSYLSSLSPGIHPKTVTITHPPYLAALSTLVSNTSDAVLSAYFTTRLALTFAPSLGPSVALRKHTRRLRALYGVKESAQDRGPQCVSALGDALGFVLGRAFVQEAFSAEDKADSEAVVKGIIDAFSDALPNVEWMDAESAAAAQRKARAIVPKIGYPSNPDTLDPAALQAYYANLTIDRADFLANVLASTRLETRRRWQTVGRQWDRGSFNVPPYVPGANYAASYGEITLSAGMLQRPYYARGRPAYLNYAGIGAIAAHELTHGFDTHGAMYDYAGRYRRWWTNATLEAFGERARCVARKSSAHYVLDDEGRKHHVPGNLTNGEDIADMGVKAAYAAWTRLREKKQTLLPGLVYQPNQLFFIAYARGFASLTRPAAAVARLRSQPHSPDYWRVVETLRNLPAFHETFNCKRGSGMNPEHQCHVWW